VKKPKPPRNADDPEQSRRFIKAAQEAEADEPADDADVILRKLAREARGATVIGKTGPKAAGRKRSQNARSAG
jgi:hypothetical protein